MKTNNLNEIIKDYEKIVKYVIKDMKLGYKFDELYDVGIIGFVNGINTYDSNKGTKCISYVCECVKNQILQYLQHENMKKREAKLVSLNLIVNDMELIDTIPSYYDYDRNLYLQEINSIINRRLSWLSKRDEMIFKHIYGIDGFEELSIVDLGKKFNTSKQNVQRIKMKVLRMLRYEIREYYKTYQELMNGNNQI